MGKHGYRFVKQESDFKSFECELILDELEVFSIGNFN